VPCEINVGIVSITSAGGAGLVADFLDVAHTPDAILPRPVARPRPRRPRPQMTPPVGKSGPDAATIDLARSLPTSLVISSAT